MKHLPARIWVIPLAASLWCAGIIPVRAQSGAVPAFTPSVAIPGISETRSSFLGSVLQGKETGATCSLSLQEALERGLRQNLGLLQSEEAVRFERGRRWQELSALLPNLKASTSANLNRDNLAAQTGLTLPDIPPVIGPYEYYDIRVFLTQSVFDLAAINRTKAANRNLKAAEHSYRDARELVVSAVGNAYLKALAYEARVEAARAQLDTARTLFDNAAQLHKEGVTPGIDELRARVELQTRRQELISGENEYAKQKMEIARAIGLPAGQDLILTDKAPYAPLGVLDAEQALQAAWQSRQDYMGAEAIVEGAELLLKAATAEYLPSLSLQANYGGLGTDPGKLKETYTVSGILTIPIFLGGAVQGEVLKAEAALTRSRDDLADLRGRIDFEVRASLLDLKAAAEQVEAAQTRVELAELTLSQASKRFTAGVTDNLEVVQAQSAVAAAHEAYISSLYDHNLAKLELARAIGVSGKDAQGFLKGM